MDYLHARATADLATLDAFLEDRRFLLASGPTIADISCSAYLHWLDQAGLAEADYPNLAQWLDRVRSLPDWQHPDLAMRGECAPVEASTSAGSAARNAP
jgi:glutathione S-transferase